MNSINTNYAQFSFIKPAFKGNINPAVAEDNSVKNDAVSFPHLSRYLKHHWVDAPQLNKILNNNPNLSRNIGSPPKHWINSVKGDEKKELINKIFDSFADFSLNVSPISDCDEEFSELINDFESELGCLLNKDVQVEYLTSGSMGKVFKVTVDGKKYALKNYKKDRATGNGHGRSEETQKAIYVKNNEQKHRFSQFYFGKVAKSEDHDGFMLTEFVENMPLERKSLTTAQKRQKDFDIPYIVSYDSCKDNALGSKVIDYGDLHIELSSLEDAEVRRHTRIITDRLKNGKPLEAAEYVKNNIKDKKIMDALRAIEIMTSSKSGFFYETFLETHDISLD